MYALLPHLPILLLCLFTMLLCHYIRRYFVCLLCYYVFIQDVTSYVYSVTMSLYKTLLRMFTLSSAEPGLGIELCPLLAQLELQDMIRADSAEDLPCAHLLSTADAHRSEVAVD